MSQADFVAGWVLLIAVAGLPTAAAVVAVHRRLPALVGATRWCAIGLLATLGLVGAHVLPLALGILTRGTVLGAAGLTLVLALALPRAPAGDPAPPPAPRGPERAPARVLGAAAALLVGAVTIAAALDGAAGASTGIDMVNFHLPGVARWIQTGTVWDVNQFVPRLTHGNYPNNGDVVLLASVLPWRSDFLARLSMLPFLALTGLCVYALARELRAPAGAATTAAAALCAIPVVLESSVTAALPDPVMWATFAGGLLFLARHSRTGNGAELALAGIGLGLAFGTKWYGVWAFGVALVVWAGAGLLARRPGWPLARGAAILAGLAAACGGVWYARNWVESGNPAFPVKVELFGVTVLDAPRDTAREAAGFTIAGYLDDPSVWREHLLDTYLQILGPPALMLVLGALAAAVVASRRPRDGRALALAAASALLAVAYALTPYSAQGAQGFPVFAGPNTRYALPALLAAAPLAALALGRLGARRPWAGAAVQVLALVAVGDGLRRAFDVGAVRLLAGAAVVASAAALAAAVRAGSRRLPASARAPAAAGAAVLALAGLGAAARHDEREFDRGRYRAVDATFDWVLRNAPAHRRIALAGNWSHGIAPPFPMFGPRLRNRVAFHGRWVERMLQPHRAPGPFLRDLRAGGYDLLVVGRGFDAALGAPPAGDVREERWARNAGLRPVARSDTLTLFAVGR